MIIQGMPYSACSHASTVLFGLSFNLPRAGQVQVGGACQHHFFEESTMQRPGKEQNRTKWGVSSWLVDQDTRFKTICSGSKTNAHIRDGAGLCLRLLNSQRIEVAKDKGNCECHTLHRYKCTNDK
jgi:hypothetical protein